MSSTHTPAPLTSSDRRASTASLAELGALNWFIVVLALALIAGVSLFLSPQWRHNPDLSHGWFTPLVFILLIHETRTRGTQRFLPAGKLAVSAVTACVIAGLLLLIAGGLYMAALDWTHALVALMVTSALCAMLAATWIIFSLESVRLVPFNWIAAVAIFIWLLSIPLPPGTYATLTQTLQAGVTRVVIGLLHFLGIAAVRHGNIIQLTNVSVGVEEACSGVRSLLSCIYAGFFFSAALVRRPWSRVWIIALAAPLAIVMNILRSFTLTLLAHKGVAISGAWHDVTGFAILGITAALLALLALKLERSSDGVAKNTKQIAIPKSPEPSQSARGPQRLVASGMVLAIVIALLFILNTRPASFPSRPPPDLAALLPTNYAGWESSASDDLYRFSDQLQTKHLAQTTYQRKTASSAGPLVLTVYLAYWPTGQVPVSSVASHTPDACWPGSGWSAKPQPDLRTQLTISQRQLDLAEYRQFTQGDYLQHVWYWHIYDGRVIHPESVRSPRQLLLMAFKYGFHRDGEQLFVRVSSNQPWDTIAHEPLLQEIFARLTQFGL